jgi:hypothetical protein
VLIPYFRSAFDYCYASADVLGCQKQTALSCSVCGPHDFKAQRLMSDGSTQAVNQLISHFEAYKDVPKISELREKFKGIKDMLKSHVFSDFARLILNLDTRF